MVMASGERQAAGSRQPDPGRGWQASISRRFDTILAAIGEWLDGPSRAPCSDPGASRRRS
jgi:hypothetical protein